jgi:hypothetical protein
MHTNPKQQFFFVMRLAVNRYTPFSSNYRAEALQIGNSITSPKQNPSQR